MVMGMRTVAATAVCMNLVNGQTISPTTVQHYNTLRMRQFSCGNQPTVDLSLKVFVWTSKQPQNALIFSSFDHGTSGGNFNVDPTCFADCPDLDVKIGSPFIKIGWETNLASTDPRITLAMDAPG
eukprot:gene49288-27842_t